MKTAKVCTKGMKPSRARPAAKDNMFCSAMPIEKNLSGYATLKASASQELVRSADNTSTFGLSLAQVTRLLAWTRESISITDAPGRGDRFCARQGS